MSNEVVPGLLGLRCTVSANRDIYIVIELCDTALSTFYC